MSNFTHEIINNILAKMWLFGINWVFCRYYIFVLKKCVLFCYLFLNSHSHLTRGNKLNYFKVTDKIYNRHLSDNQNLQRHQLFLLRYL